MIKQLDIYQEKGINALARKAADGRKSIVLQLATGGGKTVMFAGLVNRFLQKQQKKILILVHREELLRQAIRTIYEWYGIQAAAVTADSKHLPHSAMVYVAMVETAYNRLKKNPNYFGTIGLLIIDECHIANFNKLYAHFPDVLRIGFTATPLAASLKDPLKNYFEDIVACIDIPDLIEVWRKNPLRGLVGNWTYHIPNVDRKSLSVTRGEFDEAEMSGVFSSVKHVQNTLNAYKRFGEGRKTLIFNCNIAHSKKVNDLFQSFGYPSRHVDGETDPTTRAEIMKWFKNTPGAILQNIGILTTGFDEPSVQTVMVNRATMSLPLWLQMTGRGSRPFPGKEKFVIIDMGGNAMYHGDWSYSRDWQDIFFNPEKPKGPGEAPMKSCVNCKVLIHLSQVICPHCGAVNRKEVVYDGGVVRFELLSAQKPIEINVAQLINDHATKVKADGSPYKEFAVLHTIKYRIIAHAQRVWKLKRLDDKTANKLIDLYCARVDDWIKVKGDKYQWCNKQAKGWMLAELKRAFDWEPIKQTA